MTTPEYDDDNNASETELSREGIATESAPKTQLESVETDLSKKTVLILEDDPPQILLLQRYLSKLQMAVIVCKTVAEARRQLHERKPQLAIFDVRLPDGSGLELCEEIDANPELSGIPIIVLSSLESEDMVRKTRASGGRFFLGKPYDPNVLLLVIESALRE